MRAHRERKREKIERERDKTVRESEGREKGEKEKRGENFMGRKCKFKIIA